MPANGFPGCAAYDCFGAGQRIAQQTFGGRDWRAHPEVAASMFAAFATMRHLHELLWYLREALGWAVARRLHDELRRVQFEVEKVAGGDAAALVALDVNPLRERTAPLLCPASALVRSDDTPDRSDTDLIGSDLRGLDLRRADLRNSRLRGADLRGLDLFHTDTLGADLRGADVRGTDLSAALYLTQPQLAAGRGDLATRLPDRLDRSPHWRGVSSRG